VEQRKLYKIKIKLTIGQWSRPPWPPKSIQIVVSLPIIIYSNRKWFGLLVFAVEQSKEIVRRKIKRIGTKTVKTQPLKMVEFLTRGHVVQSTTWKTQP
jgi:hypothetical protein